jgi:hypothetical protein
MPRGAARHRLRILLAALPLGVLGLPVQAAPADTLATLWTTLNACVRLADVPAPALGSEVTVLFSLTRRGALQGRPRITHAKLAGREGDQQAFVGEALRAVSRCLPLDVTEGLGGAIAGRPFRIRITSRRPERAL